jgi:hypothetical protein
MVMKQSPKLSAPGQRLLDRRHFLAHASSGLSSIALAHLLARDGLLATEDNGRQKIDYDPARPFAPRAPHFPPKVKSVLVIFCAGAVSHIDSWDYKPDLEKYDGKPLPGAPSVTFQGPSGNAARPQYAFRPRGEIGKMTSDLFPKLGELVDDFCFIHSLTSKSNTHGPAENFLSTGFTLDGFPSIGAWVTYGLGTENEDLPAFVAIPDPRGTPQASINNWGPGFLPAVFQGTSFNSTNPVRNLERPANVSAESDRAALELLQQFNDRHLQESANDSNLAARIASYELAAKMQVSVPEVNDLSTEPQHILKMYGADDTKNTTKAAFARNCILARRLIEKGVRFVQLFNGAYASGGALNWDGHNDLKAQYDVHGEIIDQPAAALITDMRRRGLLEETLVVWCTEFGRMPMFQKGAKGRDHNPHGFTAFLTGGGVKRGCSYGATDDFGFYAIERPAPLYDLNATILHLLGLDHERLTYYHNGLQRRLTDVHGHVLHEVLL